ncbi:hypothetical protein [Paracoccus sp. 22332]|uniref:hypothetical protein n=1 Tax=Paracoccus sp. 22332 TaxID=3453913 RepID=UPI003F85320F
MTARATFTDEDMHALRAINAETAIRAIAGRAAATAGMTLARLTGTDRSVAAVRVRDIACYVAHRDGFNFAQIAKVMQRHPTVVADAIRREQARRGKA